MDLTKVSNQVISQMIGDEVISANISKKMFNRINKVGAGSVLAVALSVSSGMVHADDSRKVLAGTVALSGIIGILRDGSKPADVPFDCNVQGTSGYKVGGAGVAAAVLGNQIGGGNGKKILTFAGGFLAATAAQNVENDRIRGECLKAQANRQQAAYSNTNHQPNYLQYPTSNNSALPQEMVLYAVEDQRGSVSYISMAQSPGVSALRGQGGGQDPYSNKNVQVDMERTMQKMIGSYQDLDNKSNSYLNVANGRVAQGEQVIRGRGYVEQENVMLQKAISQYSKDRAFFVQTADNAAISGYNLNSYSNALDYLASPPSLQVAFGGRNINRFSTLKSTFSNR